MPMGEGYTVAATAPPPGYATGTGAYLGGQCAMAHPHLGRQDCKIA